MLVEGKQLRANREEKEKEEEGRVCIDKVYLMGRVGPDHVLAVPLPVRVCSVEHRCHIAAHPHRPEHSAAFLKLPLPHVSALIDL